MGRGTGGLALVTGGAGDIGTAVARALAAVLDTTVLVADRDRADAEAAAERLTADGVAAEPLALDVTSEKDWSRAADAIEGHAQRLAVVVNAAGVEGRQAPLWEQRPADFEAVVRVNLTGTFLALRTVLPILRRHGGGAVVNVASTAGILGLPGLAPYVASKHGVVGLTRAAATECARSGVRVNAVCPGPTVGRMIASIEAGAAPDNPGAAGDRYRAAIPMRRYAEPAEVAAVIVQLASPSSSYVTGTVVPVDGGMSAL